MFECCATDVCGVAGATARSNIVRLPRGEERALHTDGGQCAFGAQACLQAGGRRRRRARGAGEAAWAALAFLGARAGDKHAAARRMERPGGAPVVRAHGSVRALMVRESRGRQGGHTQTAHRPRAPMGISRSPPPAIRVQGGAGSSQLALKLRGCSVFGKRAKRDEDGVDDEEREFLVQGRP